jgi:hypothetical protein
MPTITVQPASVVEGGYLNFTVTLSEPATVRTTVQYRFLNGTADDSDNSGNFGTSTATFEVGQTSLTIQLYASGDSADEIDESVFLELFNPSSGAVLAGGVNLLRTTGVILDNDGAGSNQALFVGSPNIVEGDSGVSHAVFEIRLSRPAVTDTLVNYSTIDGTAVSGIDYGAVNGSILVRAGQSVTYVSVPVYGDASSEMAENFSLQVTTSGSTVAGSMGIVGTATLQDDDAPNNLPSISVQTANVVEGGYLNFTVTLSEPATVRTTVQYRFLNGTADDSDNSGNFGTSTATFEVGQTSLTIQLYASGDSADEIDESVFLELFNPSSGAVLAGGVNLLRTTGVILDNDGAGSNQALFAAPIASVERDPVNGDSLVFVIELSRPQTSSVTFSYEALPGTALEGSDYLAVIGSVTLLAGHTRAVVRVPIVNDLGIEAAETMQLRIIPGAGLTGAPFVVTGTITDNDINGTDADNVLNGTSRPDDIVGFGGNDQLIGNDGDDLLNGGLGNDFLNGGGGLDLADYSTAGGAVFVRLDTGVTTGAHGTDTLSNMEGAIGSAFGDVLTGDGGVNILRSGAGNDHLRGWHGSDIIDGGSGVDIAFYAGVRRQYSANSASVAGGPEGGTDSLTAIEYLRFVDGFLTFDVDSQAAQVMRLYDAALDRLPDQGGFENLLDYLEGGGSLSVLASSFLNSAEFQARYGGLSNQAFVQQMYRFCLNREGEPAGVQNWTNALNNGTSRTEMLVLFSESAEHRTLTQPILNQGLWVADDNALKIARMYDATFDRLPDSGGLAAWTANLAGGQSLLSIAAAFASSGEFQARYGALTNQQFVEQMYRFCLNREGDAGGVAGWVANMNNGTTRAQVLMFFSESAEHVALTRPLWLGGVRTLDAPGAAPLATSEVKADDAPQVLIPTDDDQAPFDVLIDRRIDDRLPRPEVSLTINDDAWGRPDVLIGLDDDRFVVPPVSDDLAWDRPEVLPVIDDLPGDLPLPLTGRFALTLRLQGLDGDFDPLRPDSPWDPAPGGEYWLH